MSIPVAQASVIRRSAIDWRDFPVEVGAAWDLWLGYLACRTGKACYYLPERLTRYRAHSGSVTATGSDDGSLGMILMYARLMAMPELAGLRSEIETRCGAAHLSYGLFLMQTGRAREARKHLRDAMRPARADAEDRAGVRAGEHAGHAWRRHAAGAAPRAPMVTTPMRRAGALMRIAVVNSLSRAHRRRRNLSRHRDSRARRRRPSDRFSLGAGLSARRTANPPARDRAGLVRIRNGMAARARRA